MALRAVGVVVRQGLAAVGGGRLPVPALRISPALAACQCQPQRHYAMRQELTEHGIVWRRPEKVPSWKPEKSGDLQLYKEPDEGRLQIKFLPAKEAWEKADDVTKHLLTLKFGNKDEKLKATQYDFMRDVQRHQYDTGSMEVTIAMLTARIRKAQEELLTTTKGKKKMVRKRVVLQEAIDRRKKLLKHLRRMDYKKFEWLLAKLDILYRPPPRYYRWVTRKISLRKLVFLHGKRVMETRMEEYRLELEGKKDAFVLEKRETLAWIAQTEASIGIPVSVKVPQDSSDDDSSSVDSSSSPSSSSSSE